MNTILNMMSAMYVVLSSRGFLLLNNFNTTIFNQLILIVDKTIMKKKS